MIPSEGKRPPGQGDTANYNDIPNLGNFIFFFMIDHCIYKVHLHKWWSISPPPPLPLPEIIKWSISFETYVFYLVFFKLFISVLISLSHACGCTFISTEFFLNYLTKFKKKIQNKTSPFTVPSYIKDRSTGSLVPLLWVWV